MAYNESERSELERRFEALYSQIFQCPWQKYLKAQYPVHTNGRTYFIDYVYEGDGEKIGIELEGRDKFFRYKHVFDRFFPRRNSIQMAGIRPVYSFTWSDVVDDGGYRARKQLIQIFQGKLKLASHPTHPILAPTEQTTALTLMAQARRQLVRILKGQLKPASPQTLLLTQGKPNPEEEPQARVPLPRPIPLHPQAVYRFPADAEPIEYRPWPHDSHPQRRGTLKGFALGVVAVGVLAFLWSRTPLWLSREAHQNPARLSQDASLSKTPSRPLTPPEIKKHPVSVHRTASKPASIPASPHTRQPNKAFAAVSVPSGQQSTEKAALPPPPTPQVQTPLETPSPAEEPSSRPITAMAPSLPITDDIVAFNVASGIYHNPSCYWARQCTRNCIYISRSQAEQQGGRPARSCGPHD